MVRGPLKARLDTLPRMASVSLAVLGVRASRLDVAAHRQGLAVVVGVQASALTSLRTASVSLWLGFDAPAFTSPLWMASVSLWL